MREALEVAHALGKRFEGLSLVPYLCPARIPTIGRGTVFKPDGTRVTMQDPPITVQTADEWLNATLVRDCLPAAVKFTPALIADPGAIGAITDFIYNLGPGDIRTAPCAIALIAGTGRRRIGKFGAGSGPMVESCEGYSSDARPKPHIYRVGPRSVAFFNKEIESVASDNHTKFILRLQQRYNTTQTA